MLSRANVALTVALYDGSRNEGRGGMQYEVVETTGAWIVRYAGLELARFDVQSAALQDIARRLRDESRAGGTTKLSLRYQPKAD